jgi:ABC-type bacteriocin/lantibiotic exporter with double-glycine peptidase domain
VQASGRWFLGQVRPFFRKYLLSVLFATLSSFMFLLDPLIIKWLIDDVIPRRSMRLLVFATGGLFGVYVSRLILSAVASMINLRTVQALIYRLRVTLLEQMNRLSANYHETTPVGEKLYRMEQDVDQVAELGSNVLPYALQSLLNAIFISITMLVLNRRLAYMALPLILVFIEVRRRFDSLLRTSAGSAQSESSRENAFLQEHLASVLQIQLLNQQHDQAQAFSNCANTRVESVNRRSRLEIAFRVCCMVPIAVGTVIVLGYGGYQVFIGSLTIGGLVAFYSYLARLFDPVNAAVAIYSQLNRLNASLRRLWETMEIVPDISEATHPVVVTSLKGNLEMAGVTFSYRDGLRVLDGIDFGLRPGEKIALVGPSGGGKSTIAKLIARLYDATEGEVRLDGINIKKIQLNSLRRNVCYVMQEPILFDITLEQNLLLGNPAATKNELIRALEMTDLIDLIGRLPQGWDTRIGPRANFLSGGERQRLALARAVLCKPRIMLLDEATSAVDGLTERRILTNLARHFADTAILFISHRLTSLNWVDRVLVLNRGVIQEQGTHPELVSAEGLYSCLYNSAPLMGSQV